MPTFARFGWPFPVMAWAIESPVSVSSVTRSWQVPPPLLKVTAYQALVPDRLSPLMVVSFPQFSVPRLTGSFSWLSG